MDCLPKKMVCQANAKEQLHILLTWNLKLCWAKCQERYLMCFLSETFLMTCQKYHISTKEVTISIMKVCVWPCLQTLKVKLKIRHGVECFWQTSRGVWKCGEMLSWVFGKSSQSKLIPRRKQRNETCKNFCYYYYDQLFNWIQILMNYLLFEEVIHDHYFKSEANWVLFSLTGFWIREDRVQVRAITYAKQPYSERNVGKSFTFTGCCKQEISHK